MSKTTQYSIVLPTELMQQFRKLAEAEYLTAPMALTQLMRAALTRGYVVPQDGNQPVKPNTRIKPNTDDVVAAADVAIGNII